jgi:FtsP/CotA-like multicopper oxidase with cupredoxin domain
MRKRKLTIYFSIVFGAALLLAGTVQAAFLVPQTHHPGVFFEKYATPLPNFGNIDGLGLPSSNVRVNGTVPVTVTYEEFRQHILPETFYTGDPAAGLPAQVFPYIGGTLVWGYDVGGPGVGLGPIFPGNTIEAQRGTSTQVTYVNNLAPSGDHVGPDLQRYLTIDQTIHWANPLGLPGPPISRLEEPPYAGPQPVVSHLHGGEVPSSFDGAPDQWFTESGIHGPGYRSMGAPAANAAIYQYPNEQEAATLWFHDHALGITRINVYAGVAAYYFLRDGFDTGVAAPDGLPADDREVEFVIQDRMFDIVGNLLFPDGLPFFVPNPQHPFWNPEFLGDVIVVNGRSWPFLDVDPQRYRIRFLNGSNARFYNMSLAATGKGKKIKPPPFWVIGTDGGLLDNPVMTNEILIAPGERYDVIINFAGKDGTTFVLNNDAKSPYPFGEAADPHTVGQIAQFRVSNEVVVDNTYDPSMDPGDTLRAANPIERLVNADGTLDLDVTVARYRQLTLNEIPGPFGPLDAVLNNTLWGGKRDDGTVVAVDAGPLANPANVGPQGLTLGSGTVAPVTNYMTEFPQNGSTEVWEIINLTGDAHPIHLHLVQFQVLNREGYNVKKYEREYLRAFPGGAAANPNSGIFLPHFGPPAAYNTPNADGAIGGNPAISPFLSGNIIPPTPYEFGWKDTVIALPKQVTRIVARWTPQDIPVGTESPGTNYFTAFDPTAVGSPAGGIVGADGGDGPGYVWHCHIIDHEDNEMMRPYVPVPHPENQLDPPIP